MGARPGRPLDSGGRLAGLPARGARQLMAAGGGQIHTQFLAQNLADEVHLAIAPLLVGQADAPSFIHPADYPGGTTSRMRLLGVQAIGDVVLVRYAPKERSA